MIEVTVEDDPPPISIVVLTHVYLNYHLISSGVNQFVISSLFIVQYVDHTLFKHSDSHFIDQQYNLQ